jgi:osmotically-inducible protein OsmY
MIKYLATTALLLTLTGCVPAILGGGAYTVSKATSARGLGGTVSDIQVQGAINKLWWDNDADLMKRLDLVVQEGRVLITGNARDTEQKLAASRLAWQATGVQEVINEATVANKTTLTDEAKDTWIATKLRTIMTFDTHVAGRNYTIQPVNGIVYLMGYARNQTELDRVTTHARTLNGVQKVVSYVRVGNELPPANP